MVFLTTWFFIFLVLSVAGFWILPGQWRRLFLLLTSAVFHTHFAGPAGVLPIVALAVTVYFAGLWTERKADQVQVKFPFSFLAGGLCVLALLYYKYTSFLLGLVGISLPIDATPIAPLAISFFTFEFIHYLVEVGKGAKAIRDPIDFALFSIYFPTIASGPIKRLQDFSPQVETLSELRWDTERFHRGVFRIVSGLFKKLILAEWCMNHLQRIEPWLHDSGLGRSWLWALMGLQTLRIYFDFAGYSDVAIGVSLCFGIRVPENFNWPYLARNLSDFWTRWHISLSSWIRDYLYIPLGGGRVPLWRKTLNGTIAMLLCGIWHGPALHFAAWGLWHGVGIALQNPLGRVLDGVLPENRGATLRWLRIGVARVSTVMFVAFGWLIFFYEWKDLSWILRNLFL